MISIFSHDEFAALGLATALDIERIPYRRIRRLAEHDHPLLVVLGGDLSADESAVVAAQRSLVMNGGARFAAQVLGAPQARIDEAPVLLPLDARLWPADVAALAQGVAQDGLRIPRAPFCRVAARAHGEPLAELHADGGRSALPAVLAIGDCLWSAVDLGAAFAHLLNESYGAADGPGRAPLLRAWARRAAESAYYAAPARVRELARQTSYRGLERRLQGLGERASSYPVDATGWLLLELIKTLLRRAAGGLVRIARWPAGCQSAAVLTHDLEPRRYAYNEGLARLLERAEGDRAPHAFGVVATAAARHLAAAQQSSLARHEIYCHGLNHRGEQVWGRRRVGRLLRAARARVETQFGAPVAGYRSPRLDRSPDLDWALDDAGFAYDSSHPDVDRENLQHYGAGVRLTLPYRPLLADGGGRWRASRCLELPMTAPDCIQPLFVGDDVAQLRDAVARKADFVHASGGLYVALVHAGVFGDEDGERRMAHLDFVTAQLRRPGLWLTGMQQAVAWWIAREQLHVVQRDGALVVRNDGPSAVDGAILIIERDGARDSLALPSLAAGATYTLGGAARAAHTIGLGRRPSPRHEMRTAREP
jgi:peptidoglycan/xylan/chitin deacetylase (PgdA/CDA1 family)